MTEKTEKTKTASKKPEVRSPAFSWELVERVLGCVALTRIYVWGPPGVGKTFAAYHQGRLERGLYACTLVPELSSAELRGTYLPKGDTIEWHDGPVIRAMREGARLVLNEISHAGEDVLAFLYPILEHDSTCRLTLPTGETVTPAPGFHVIVTDNLPSDDLPAALRDRFDAQLEIREPHPEALALLSEPMREVARRGIGLDEDRRLSVRALLAIERVKLVLGLREACLVVLGAARGALFYDAALLAGVR